MNSGRVPITNGRIDLVAGGPGHDADAVMGRMPAMSVSWQNTCMSNADAILWVPGIGCNWLEATFFIALPRVDVQLAVGVCDGVCHWG